jgi:hypothetical protein
MQNQIVKVMVQEHLGPQYRKVILHAFIWETLANMTQVSDVAPQASCYQVILFK